MDVRVLGPVEVLLDGVLIPLGGLKQRTVLALLAVSPGQTVPADALIFGLYGDEAPATALRTIHTYVSNLRHEVGDLIVRSGDGYRMVLENVSSLDSSDFEDRYMRGSNLVADDPATAGSLLREGLSLWRGHAFADVEAHAGLEAEITRLTEMRISALEARVEADLAQGAHREIIGEIEALGEQYPLRETFRAQHMLALYRSGRQAEALRAYQRTRSVLAEELGIDPTPGLQELEEMILTQDPQLDIPPAATVERLALLTAELGEAWRDEPIQARDEVLAGRDAVLSASAATAGGTMFDVRGNAALAAFATVGDALNASRELSAMNLQVAIDYGEVEVIDERVTGPPVNRSLRLAAIANPGQIILSYDAQAALAASEERGWSVISLGAHKVRGLNGRNQLFQLTGEGMETEFGALRLDRLPQPLPGDGRGGPLPGYELRGEIGSNAFSAVYRAYQASVGREVAVRVFNSELVSDPRFIRRFEAVAQRIASVEHPHLLPMLDYWREPGRAVLVHRLIKGRTLRDRVAERGLEAAELLALVQKIGSALAVSHDHGLVHGRVSAGNVLLDDVENPYLADLGVATIVDGLVAVAGQAPPAPSTDVGALRGLVEEVAARGYTLPELADGGSVATFLGVLKGVSPSASLSPTRNPYKGLAAYDVGDATDFYGRDDLVAKLLEAVASQPLTMVVGPSGIGKSSVVKAGLVPALRNGAVPGSGDWLFTDMYPGDHPFDRLEIAMARVALSSPEEHLEAMRQGGMTLSDAARHFLPEGATLLLVIDQFEELFTQVIDEGERRRFLDVLSELAGDADVPVKVVATVRADFFDRPLRYAEFGSLVSDAPVMVAAPSREELAAIVECPAKSVGVAIEEGLIDALVEDADQEIGGLPLLQLALTELFEGRTSDLMTLEEYRSAGGLAATVGRRAEDVFQSLNSDDQRVAREICLSLVSVEQDRSDTRRRTRSSELEGLGSHDSVQGVLEAFGKARLFVFDRDPVTRGPTVEVAHEALIARWDRYRVWIDEVRDDLLARRRVELATREWLDSGEDADYLLTGSRLEGAESWRDQSGMRVGPDEARFLAESRDAVDAERARIGRRRRRVFSGLSAALVVLLVLGMVAWVQRNAASRSRVEARVQELTAQAHLALTEDPSLAINLALEAYDQAQALGGVVPGAVMTALQTTMQSSRLVAVLSNAGGVDLSYFASWSPDSSAMAMGSSTNAQEVVVYTTDGFTEMARFDAGGPVFKVNFAPDGETLAVSYDQRVTAAGPDSQDPVPVVARFEVGTWEKVDEFVGPCCSDWFEFSPDGRYLASAWGWGLDHDPDFTTVWDTDTPDRPRYVYQDAYFESWSPDSSEFVAVQVDPSLVHVIDAAGGMAVETLEVSSLPSFPNFDPSTGDLAVTLGTEGLTRIVSPTGEVVDEYAGPAITRARFSRDGDLLIQWGNRDDVLITTLETRDTLQLHGHRGGVRFVTQSPDGRFMAATTTSGETMIWDLTDAGPELWNVPIGGVVRSAEPGSDGSTWHAIRLAGANAYGVTLSPDGAFEESVSSAFVFSYFDPVSSPSGLIGGRSVDGRGKVENVATGDTVLQLPEEECGYPVALDDPGELVLIGGGEICGYDAGGGGVIDLRSGEYLFEMPVLPIYATFGHPGTSTEDLIVINTGYETNTMEVRRLPEGELLGSMEVEGFAFRPFVSADGRWATWGSQTGGAFLVDLEAVAAGAPMGDSVVFNPRVEAGVTNFTRSGGDYLSAAYSRGAIRVWRIDSRELWFTLPESEHLTFTWQFISDDGRYLFYADGGLIRRMPLDPDELASLARERSLRDFSVEECERFLAEETDCAKYEQ